MTGHILGTGGGSETDFSKVTLPQSGARSAFKYYNSQGQLVNGTMNEQGAKTVTPSSSEQLVVPANTFVTGDQKVRAIPMSDLHLDPTFYDNTYSGMYTPVVQKGVSQLFSSWAFAEKQTSMYSQSLRFDINAGSDTGGLLICALQVGSINLELDFSFDGDRYLVSAAGGVIFPGENSSIEWTSAWARVVNGDWRMSTVNGRIDATYDATAGRITFDINRSGYWFGQYISYWLDYRVFNS